MKELRQRSKYIFGEEGKRYNKSILHNTAPVSLPIGCALNSVSCPSLSTTRQRKPRELPEKRLGSVVQLHRRGRKHKICRFHHVPSWVNLFPAAFSISDLFMRVYDRGASPIDQQGLWDLMGAALPLKDTVSGVYI